MAEIIEPKIKKVDKESKILINYAAFRKEVQMPTSQHLIVLQNTNRRGLTLKLDSQSLVEVVTHFALACSSNYKDIFPVVLEYKDLVAFGISSLQVDKFLLIDYLLDKTMLNAMDMSSVNQKEVSASFACEMADQLLKDKLHLLSHFFEDKEEKPFSQVQEQFQQETQEILNQCTELFDRQKSIPVKAAILAALLSKTDCELFTQSVYNRDSIRIYDLFSEGLDFFIENDYGNYYTINGEKPFNPIPELKRLDAMVIDLETQKRSLTEQLTSLEQQIKGSHEVQRCHIENGLFFFNNQQFRLMPDIEQELLEETHQPKEGLVIPESIDLRGGFRPIQSQGSQGSCLAHALTALFEYAIKISTSNELDLSEAFLYYNARELDNTGDISVLIDKGSRVKPAVESLVKYGLAQEQFCQYDQDYFSTKPSNEAYADAYTRRLIKAMNVGKSTNAIKAALAEGYPVAISLALCDSFAEASIDGYVPMPTPEEIEERNNTPKDEEARHSSHAMVIVGYSDKLCRFIVRNSWSASWGDKGYCYVPFDYIDNPQLCQSATIFTEIESLSQVHMVNIPTLSVNDQDLQIRYYITQAMRDKVSKDLLETKQKRLTLFSFFTTLTAEFSKEPENRQQYSQAADEALGAHIDEMQKRRRKVDVELEELGKSQRRNNIIQIAIFVGVIVASLGIVWLINLLLKGLSQNTVNYLWSFVVIVPFTIYSFFKTHQQWKEYREQKHKLENEHTSLSKEIAKIKEIKARLNYKTFAAYHLLQMMTAVRDRLENTYINYLRLINNLRAWYTEIDLSKTSSKLDKPIPTISLLEQTRLDEFFDTQLKDNERCAIDFCSVIKPNGLIEDSELASLRREIIDTATIQLLRHPKVANFHITNHTVSAVQWVRGIDKSLGIECSRIADIFIHLSAIASPSIAMSRFLFAPNAIENSTRIREIFTSSPAIFNSDNSHRMTYFTTALLNFEDCDIFVQKQD